MLTKLIILFVILIAIIVGIYYVFEIEDGLEKYAKEYIGCCVMGSISLFLGLIIAFSEIVCDCNGSGERLGWTLIVAGATLFIEPFIHYFICKK